MYAIIAGRATKYCGMNERGQSDTLSSIFRIFRARLRTVAALNSAVQIRSPAPVWHECVGGWLSDGGASVLCVCVSVSVCVCVRARRCV